MEIVSRIENKLLNRVEIDFKWNHKGSKTPSKKEVMDLVKTLEPGSNPDFIVVKDCKTRYGQALTTGIALIYGTSEAMRSNQNTFMSVTRDSEAAMLQKKLLKKRLKKLLKKLPKNQRMVVNDGRT